MKIKRLFHISVLGTEIYKSLVFVHGKRTAIKEVNKVVRCGCSPYLITEKFNRHAHITLWAATPQGHEFWATLYYKRYDGKTSDVR